jgi:hypothetical protein
MVARVIEASLLVPEKDGTVSTQPTTKAEAVKYFRDTKPTAQKKESAVDSLEQRMQEVEGLKTSSDYQLVPKEDTDTQDPLEHLIGGYNVVFTSKAKKAWQDVIYALEDDLNSSHPKSRALIYKPESAKIVATLFELIGLKSEDGDEYLAPVQREARNLLESAVANGSSMAGVDPYSRDCVLRMLSANKSEAIRGTVDLIRSEGLDKLAKRDSGFIGKLTRSNGKLGRGLAEFVFNKIKALTSRPLDMTADSDIQEDARLEIQSLKTELFETTFTKIKEEFDKKKTQIKDLKDEDADFVEEFEKRARTAFMAQEVDEAEAASRELTGLVVSKVARIQDATAAIQTATELRAALGSSPKYPQSINIPKEVINGLKDNAALKQAWYNQVVANAQHVITVTPSISTVTISKKQIIDRLEQMRAKAGNSSVPLDDFIITNGTHNPTNNVKSKSLSLTEDDIKTLVTAVASDGSYTTRNWPQNSSLATGSINHKDVFDAICYKIKEEIVLENTTRTQKARTINAVSQDASLSPDQKIDKVLADESSWNFTLDTSDTTSKDLAANIKSKLEDYKRVKEADKKYYSRFMEDMNRYVFASIMTKAGTVNETLRYALENSMITDDSALREEFKDSFNSLADSAKQAVSNKAAQVRNDLEAMKNSVTVHVNTTLTSILTGLGASNYADFIAKLGQGSNEDVALTKLSEALTAAGSSLGTRDKEFLDASSDSYLSSFDLARRRIERVNLISNKLLDLRTKNEKGVIGRIANPTNKTTAQNFINSCTILSSLTKPQIDTIKAKYDAVRTYFFSRIEKLETDSKSLSEIESKANEDVWELLTDGEAEKGPIKTILANLAQGVQDGLAALLRSLGLYNGDNISRLKQRVDAIDQESENKGFAQAMQKALVQISNRSATRATT